MPLQPAPDFLTLVKLPLAIIGDFAELWLFPWVRAWWWVLLPFLGFKIFANLWLGWRQGLNLKAREYLLLEIRLPKEVAKPIKAMEDVFDSLAVIGSGAPDNLKDKWITGATDILPSLSFEVTSFGGEIHFFVRVPALFRDTVEAALYSQYSELEISEARDYTAMVSQDLPNEEWDLSGTEFVLDKKDKKDCYPLKTYVSFEKEGAKEEHRVDPMAGLMEGLAFLKPGEQLWIQILISKAGKDWIKEGQKERDSLSKRPKKPAAKPILQETLELLIKGPAAEEEKKEGMITVETRLTPGEEEIVREIERKISKHGFETTIRALYLAKKDLFFWPRLQIPASFLINFSTQHLNSFKGIEETATFVSTTFLWFLDSRRSYSRKRRMFKNYLRRARPFFPLKSKKAASILNSEELASIFHFPGRTVAPAPLAPRVEAKKGEPPMGLPTE